MTEHLQPGYHLDADQLAAFAEGALTDWEREECMAHLAGCEACREILFLAQSPAEEPIPAPVLVMPAPRWRRLVPLAFATALAACLVTAVLVLRPKHPAAPPPNVAHLAPPPAMNEGALPEPPALKQGTVPAPHPEWAARRRTAEPTDQPAGTGASDDRAGSLDSVATAAPDKSSVASDQGSVSSGTVAALPLEGRNYVQLQNAAPPSVTGYAAGAGVVRGQVSATARSAPALPPAAGPVTLRIEPNQSTYSSLARVTGTVLDASGASIPGATVTLRQPAEATPRQIKTDAQGNFTLAGLAPGHYDLQIAASGFLTVTRPLDLHPSDLALLTSQLPLGAASQTVTVEAAAPMLATDSAQLANLVQAQAMQETVTLGKHVLGLNPDGSVSLSSGRGRRWKKVKPVWPGRIVRIAVSASGKEFEITTDANAVWLSSDGKHWRQETKK